MKVKVLVSFLLIFVFSCSSDSRNITFSDSDSTGNEVTDSDSGDSGDTGNTGNLGDSGEGLCKDDDASTVRPDFWTKESHCKGEDPNYVKLFNDDIVQRIDITIAASDYQASMTDLDNLLSSGGMADDSDPDPMYIPVTVEYDGLKWEYVGMRYKGNSSLRSAYQEGVKKLSFRFNFDKYEDDHPETDNQRFYGFKKMTFSNGFKDSSLIRDKLAADMFRVGGVPAARGAFYRIYVDFGQGSTYFGLYTMIEDPSDEMLGQQFDDDSGNLYKPEGAGATWASFDEASFEKKTNEEDSDWSDILAAYNALHADRSNAETWRNGLDAVFNTEAFLRCLAINQAMVNWDSYGTMTHNYYVYQDPGNDGKLHWFPWDLNEAFLERNSGPVSVITAPPGPGGDSTSIMLDEVGSNWPLIRFLLDDDVYRAQYITFLRNTLDTSLDTAFVSGLIDKYHNMIEPYVAGTDGESSPYTNLSNSNEFTNSVTELKQHIDERRTAVENAIN